MTQCVSNNVLYHKLTDRSLFNARVISAPKRASMEVAGFAKACQRNHSPVASSHVISSALSLRIAHSSKMYDARVAESVLEAMNCTRGGPRLLLAKQRHAMA